MKRAHEVKIWLKMAARMEMDDWRNAGSTVSITILEQPNVSPRKDFLVIDLLSSINILYKETYCSY